MANFQEIERGILSTDKMVDAFAVRRLYPVAQQAAEFFDGSVKTIQHGMTGDSIGFLVYDETQLNPEDSLKCSFFPGVVKHYDKKAQGLSVFRFSDFVAIGGNKKYFGFNYIDDFAVVTDVEFDKEGVASVSESYRARLSEWMKLFNFDAKIAQATVTGKDGRFIIPRVSWVARQNDEWVVRAEGEVTKTYAKIDREGIVEVFLGRFDGDTLINTVEYKRDAQRAIYAEVGGGVFTIDNVVSITTGKNNEIKFIAKNDGRVTELELDENRIIHIKGSQSQRGKPGYAFEYFADGLKGWYRVGKGKQVKMEKMIRVVRETDGWVLMYKEGEFEHEAKLTALGLSAFSGQLYDSEADREFFSADEEEGIKSYSFSPETAADSYAQESTQEVSGGEKSGKSLEHHFADAIVNDIFPVFPQTHP